MEVRQALLQILVSKKKRKKSFALKEYSTQIGTLGPVAHLVASPIADPGVVSSIVKKIIR